MSLLAGLIIVGMVGLNGLFAAYEIALASVSVGRLKVLAEQNRPGSRAALLMKQSMEASLAVVQLGITLVGAVAAATGGAGAEKSIAPWLQAKLGLTALAADALAVSLVVVPLAAATIVAGELIPKVFALRNKEWVCLKLSTPMRWTAFLFYPAVWLLEAVVKTFVAWSERRWRPRVEGHRSEAEEMQEFRAVVALARTSRLFGGQEERIILGAARLSGRRIDEIMIPIEEVATLDLNLNMADCLVAAHTEMHTRFPVCAQRGDLQTICGYVNFKDIVAQLRFCPQEPSLRGILRAIPDMPFDTTIARCMEQMTRGHVHIALVRDAGNGVAGMITLEDIIEELVGDIEDEYDRIPAHIGASGNGYVVGGGVPLERIEQRLGIPIDRPKHDARIRTLHDWVHSHLGRPPRGGDIVKQDGLCAIVRKVRRQKLLEAHVSPVSSPSPGHATSGKARRQ